MFADFGRRGSGLVGLERSQISGGDGLVGLQECLQILAAAACQGLEYPQIFGGGRLVELERSQILRGTAEGW